MKEIEKITDLADQIMEISYSECKSSEAKTAVKMSQINNKANDILKYMHSLKARLNLQGID